MHHTPRSRRTQRGNILFLILLAVVLFAALNYAVTSSMRGGGKDASSESADAKAAALIQYSGLLENTVNRMRLVGNVPEWGFDFSDGNGPSGASANSSCTSADCRVFNNSALQGQTESQKFDETYVDPRARAAFPTAGNGSGTYTDFLMVEVRDVGTSLPDVIFRISYLTPEVCKSINKILWGESVYPNESYGGFVSYSGTLTAIPSGGGIFGDESANGFYFKGKNSGCVGRENVTPAYGGDFYRVIIAR